LKRVIIIPARLLSERLPEKPLKTILDKPMINWTLEAVEKSSADIVKVATDSKKIVNLFETSPEKVVITSSSHISGTDRVFEAANSLGLKDEDIVINVQGDEPFINAKDLDNLFNLFDDEKNGIATLYSKIRNQEILKDKNIVKVEINNGFASKFMRMCLGGNNIYIHQGVYAFNFRTLKQFVNLKPSKNEIKFKLEQLRALDNGISIRAIESVSEFHIGVDTQEDLKKANEFAKKNYSK
jgi:3-deoxy-manno-octulosonate cytidylyltransferase (CMP-KDO synthetase)